jgi:hypothetical protein
VQGFDNYFPSINGTSWQVFAGVRPISWFAVEVDYIDLGSSEKTFPSLLSCSYGGPCKITWKSDAKAFGANAVGFLPIPVPYLDVYGKAGLASFKSQGTITQYGVSGVPSGSSAYSDDGTVFTLGRWRTGAFRQDRRAAGVRGLRQGQRQRLFALGLSKSVAEENWWAVKDSNVVRLSDRAILLRLVPVPCRPGQR